MKFLNDLNILLFSKKVGEDEFGNKYYEDNLKKRYVRYAGIVEATKIPPMWHAWLHQIEKKTPNKIRKKYPWQKSHQPNLTGTIYASKPRGSLAEAGRRKKSMADYESWKPK